ncbi:hypothetical protein EST38_g310 [Candolleomyces aberdarensis]|uniref:Uncharacterized protein n=1 Tax=Candolleomyces aberdarensis TaxID=2316362 RepID=A0A4Q2DYS2_9AGAR|nr:hypothetical protein EST38_g310 [Candolleomyces aberdarensis]
MSQPRRLNGPLYSPVPSLAAANQNQIEDLVQRNKTLDVTHKKLLEEVRQERERHKAELTKLKEEHAMREEEWRSQNHYMLGVARVSRLRAVLSMEDEKSKALQETRFIREEKLERIKRDYKLKLFQIGYEELENQVVQLQETKQETEAECWEEVEHLAGETEELRGTLKEALDELTRVKKARDVLQAKFDKLTEELATHQASNSTSNSKLERLKLQLEGAQTKNADLERTNDDLKRTNVQLQRQIDDWQNLEKREGDEVDNERKQRIALSVEVKKLEAQHKADAEAYEANLAKERQKVEKWRAAESSDSNEKELQASERQVSKLQKEVDKLKANLEVERARVGPPSPEYKPSSAPDPPAVNGRKASSAKPASRRGKAAKAAETDIEDEPGPSKPKPRKASQKKKKAAEPSDEEEVEETVVAEEEPEPEEEDEEVVEVDKKKKKSKAPESNAEAPKAKRKRKDAAAPPEEEEEGPKKKAKPQSKAKNTAGKAAASAIPVEDDDDTPAPAVKKKRKINIGGCFPEAVKPFDFGSLNIGGTGGLDIPSLLSPVRNDAPVPPRSESVYRASRLR